MKNGWKLPRGVPIRSVLCVAISTLIAVPVLIVAVFFQTTMRGKLTSATFDNASFYMENYIGGIENNFKKVFNIIYYIHSSEAVSLRLDAGEDLTGMDLKDTERYVNGVLFSDRDISTSFFNGAYIIQPSGNCQSIQYYDYRTEVIERYQKVYRESFDSTQRFFLVPPSGQSEYMYLVHELIDIKNWRSAGKIIIELRPEALLDAEYLTYTYPESKLYLYDSSGKIFFSNAAASGGYIQNILGPDFLETGECREELERAYFLQGRKIPGQDLYMMLLTSRAAVFRGLDHMMFLFYLIALCTLTFGIALAVIMARHVTRPLDDLVHHLNAFAGSNFSIRMPPQQYEELAALATSFNKMADELEYVVFDVYETSLQNIETELILLQTQTERDFDCDILARIGALAEENGLDALRVTIGNLERLIANSVVFKGRDRVHVREELEYVRFYLDLQKTRFEDRLNYTISVESDELLDVMIPKLLLQPVVENSVVHGLEKKRGAGHVSIMIWEEVDEICFKVTDDGAGFDVKKLDDAPAESAQKKHSHIALRNIRKRLLLLYGEEYAMQIKSRPGAGTEVFIHIPLTEQAKGKEDV